MKNKFILWRLFTGIILAVLSFFMVYSSLFVLPRENQNWIKSTLKTSGTVVEVNETFRNKAYCDHILIQFKNLGNQLFSFRPYDCFSKGAYQVNQKVQIRYNEKNPSLAAIDFGDNDNSTSVAVIVFGGFLLICGVIFMILSKRKKEV